MLTENQVVEGPALDGRKKVDERAHEERDSLLAASRFCHTLMLGSEKLLAQALTTDLGWPLRIQNDFKRFIWTQDESAPPIKSADVLISAGRSPRKKYFQ